MNTLTIKDTEIGYVDSGGDGEPVLLIHAGAFADWFTPLAAAPALSGKRVIRLVRAGYTGTPAPGPLSPAGNAGHAAALLERLHTGPAHVVAHSSGTVIALQLALDHPGLVRTLTLCEPPLVDTLAAPEDHDLLHAMLGPVMGAAMGATARGDLPAAFDLFMTAVCGPTYRQVMTDTLGAAVLAGAERNCGYFFTGEIPGLNGWTFEPRAAARIEQPVLLVQGGASPPPVHRLVARVAGLLPNATVATVDGAGHLLPLTAPAELARLISGLAEGQKNSSSSR
jgi:pimeloyl-ACP methyl ester carboxylesterase